MDGHEDGGRGLERFKFTGVDILSFVLRVLGPTPRGRWARRAWLTHSGVGAALGVWGIVGVGGSSMEIDRHFLGR